MSKKIFIKFPLHAILFLLFYSRSIQSDQYCSDEQCKEHNRNVSCHMQEWSENLEKSAQRWADQCVGQGAPDVKDECLNIETEGQNIATIFGDAPGLSPLVLVDVWYMELLHMNTSIIPQYILSSEAGLSHYDYFAQLVWAESSYVGCGGVKFKESKKDGKGTNRTVNRLVCNFFPGGNRVHKPVYVKGEPCSTCPEGSGCDLEYNALCKLIRTKGIHSTEDITKMIHNNSNTTKRNGSSFINTDQIINDTNDDEYFMPYNYFTNVNKASMETVTPSPTIGKQCKDMAVEDFLELLKKKLSNDPMFKDLASKSNSLAGDVTNTDPNVAAFVSKLYSKKVPSTTTKQTEKDFINSTLLVDLVEAVIFRSGDKMPTSVESESYFNTPIVEVNPIKIKAELSEIKLNQDFTGHYFFPEDEDETEATKTEITEVPELYEDMLSFSMSDVALEIEDFKRIKTTKDFLEEILESESASENRVIRFKRHEEETNDIDTTFQSARRGVPDLCQPRKVKIKYSDLLRQIAFDLKMLKLSDRFHCTKSYSAKHVNALFTQILCVVTFQCILK
ncbi:peptidase inhibitor 16-like isoform X2 [Plodia interpunctella]|uniref:peptidase inhibitor 16-like isoform X2 n=1 Tax=Plodia interpunctella TaxID=58824 RepID=UPI002368364E|nr:peptidase inhibitor 16-like isoform X2 [Plodia interpunctella]